MLTSLVLIAALQAGVGNYRFEPSEPAFRGVASNLIVQVTDADGRILPRLDVRDVSVSREGARRPAFFEPSLDYGSLRFRADLPITGDWILAFTLQAAAADPQPVTVAFKVIDPPRLDAQALTAPRP